MHTHAHTHRAQNDYKTLDPSFMESVWWVFKQLHEKGLVYRGFKVIRLCRQRVRVCARLGAREKWAARSGCVRETKTMHALRGCERACLHRAPPSGGALMIPANSYSDTSCARGARTPLNATLLHD